MQPGSPPVDARQMGSRCAPRRITDGTGNADPDDDGDGFSDEEELEAGTDSLNSDSFPSNGEEGCGGLPIWMLYIATQPKAA